MVSERTGGQTIHRETEFDRIYEFYERLERQERQPRLAWLILACSAIVALMVGLWVAQHPITLNEISTPTTVTR